MTGEIYKDKMKSTEKKFTKDMRKECKEFASLLYLKVNRNKDISLVLAENEKKFPFLSALAFALLFNDNPAPLYSKVKVDIANEYTKLKGGEEQGPAGIDAKETK